MKGKWGSNGNTHGQKTRELLARHRGEAGDNPRGQGTGATERHQEGGREEGWLGKLGMDRGQTQGRLGNNWVEAGVPGGRGRSRYGRWGRWWVKGRNPGSLRGHTWVNGRQASKSSITGKVRRRHHEVWGAEEVCRAPPRPRLPCPVTHLALLGTSTYFLLVRQTRPAHTATALRQSRKAVPPPPPLRPRPRPRAASAAREEGGDRTPPSFITAQWKGLAFPREAGL